MARDVQVVDPQLPTAGASSWAATIKTDGTSIADTQRALGHTTNSHNSQETALAPGGANPGVSQSNTQIQQQLNDFAEKESLIATFAADPDPDPDQKAAQEELLRRQNELAEEIAKLSPAEIEELLASGKLAPTELAIILRAREFAGVPHSEEMGMVVLRSYTALEDLGSGVDPLLREESLVAARANISQISKEARDQLARNNPELAAIYDRVVPLVGETNITMTGEGQSAETGNVGAFYQDAAAIQAQRLYSDPTAATQVHQKLEDAMLLGPELTAGELLRVIGDADQVYRNQTMSQIAQVLRDSGDGAFLAYLRANEGASVSELLSNLAENPSDPRYRDLVAATLAYRSVVVAQDYVTARREIREDVNDFNQNRNLADLYNARQVRVDGYGQVYSPRAGSSGSRDVTTGGPSSRTVSTTVPGPLSSIPVLEPDLTEGGWRDGSVRIPYGADSSQAARETSSAARATELGNNQLAMGRALAAAEELEKKAEENRELPNGDAVFIWGRLPGDSLSPQLTPETIQTLNNYGVGASWVAAGPGRTLIDTSPFALGSIEQKIEDVQRDSQRPLRNGTQAA